MSDRDYDTAYDLLIATNCEMLTRQRVHVLAAIGMAEGKAPIPQPDPLQGVLNLLDAISDFLQDDQEMFTDEQRKAWWDDECRKLGYPVEDDDDAPWGTQIDSSEDEK